MSSEAPVLTLDGPSGVGKGTVGQICAQRLGWHYLDSGAIYRALAVSVEDKDIDPGDRSALLAAAAELDLECLPNPPESAAIGVAGVDVSQRARSEACSERASILAQDGQVRAALLRLQRRQRTAPGLVADGRDMGSVVFPDATLKIFLTASPEVRAKRRYNQLKLKGFDVNLAHLFQAIQERDTRDAQRAASPLVAAPDAVTLDTSELSIAEVVGAVLELLQPKLETGRAVPSA